MRDLQAKSGLTAALLGCMLALAGCGTPAPAPGPERPPRGVGPATAKAPADALLATALRHFSEGNAAQALSYAELASDRAPQRADLAWLHGRTCMAVPGCEPEPIDARLRQLDPGNASAWLGALGTAQARQDRAAENQILEAIGRGERFDFYWNSLVAHTASALHDSGTIPQNALKDPLTQSLDRAVGWMSSLASLALRPITVSCGPQRSGDRKDALRCAKVAEVLLRGDNYLVEGVGLGIAERVLTPGTTGAQAIAEQIRQSGYQRDVAGQIIAAQVEKAKFSAEMLKLMRKLRREQDVFLTVIRWAGEPVESPMEADE